MIYVIEAIGLDRVKFGRASNPESRTRELSTGLAYPLRLLAAVDWPDKVESMIHRAFADHRVNGEWFTISVEIEEFIEALIMPSAFIDRHGICMSILSDVRPRERKSGPLTPAERQKRHRDKLGDAYLLANKLRMRKKRGG